MREPASERAISSLLVGKMILFSHGIFKEMCRGEGRRLQ